jgi:site-specific DNA-methyltransferase (adenine-specific)
MSSLSDRSVHLVVTSPPYWQLKDYDSPDQIGFDQSYEDYINNLNLVWMECSRVLHDGCRLCVNIGDQFARSVYYGRYKVIPIRTEIIRFCETIGFDFMGAIVWQKVTTCNTSGGGTVMGSFPYPRNGIVKLDYEHILLFKKHGTPPKVSRAVKEDSRLTIDEWNEYFNGHWNFPGEKQQGHLAMFPEELPRRLIRMFSFVGETVLDPFAGSGTTALAAMNLERNSVGYEINRDFETIIRERLGDTSQENATVTFEESPAVIDDSIFDRLPYRFRDPLKLDKKLDPREQTFGSRITHTDEAERDIIRVTKILSPTRLKLSDGRTVILHGVRVPGSKRAAAVRFLEDIVRGKPVTLKRDPEPGPRDDDQVYVYLNNRTFINAHLVKKDLAEIDPEAEISHRTLISLRETARAQPVLKGEAE